MRKYNLFVSVITVISLFLFTGCNNSNLSDAGKEDKATPHNCQTSKNMI